MKRFILFVALLSLTCQNLLAESEKVYRSVDSQGVVTFSDTPQPNSQAIELSPLQSYSAPVSEPYSHDPQNAPATSNEREDYTSLEITQPQDGETVWNNPGNMTVVVSTQPRLQSGDQVQVLLDGNQVAASTTSQTFNLEGIARGEHQLRAQIVSKRGSVQIASSKTVFYLHQSAAVSPSPNLNIKKLNANRPNVGP